MFVGCGCGILHSRDAKGSRRDPDVRHHYKREGAGSKVAVPNVDNKLLSPRLTINNNNQAFRSIRLVLKLMMVQGEIII